jgi:hypothetical protein
LVGEELAEGIVFAVEGGMISNWSVSRSKSTGSFSFVLQLEPNSRLSSGAALNWPGIRIEDEVVPIGCEFASPVDVRRILLANGDEGPAKEYGNVERIRADKRVVRAVSHIRVKIIRCKYSLRRGDSGSTGVSRACGLRFGDWYSSNQVHASSNESHHSTSTVGYRSSCVSGKHSPSYEGSPGSSVCY